MPKEVPLESQPFKQGEIKFGYSNNIRVIIIFKINRSH
jgi:hypothetical protein